VSQSSNSDETGSTQDSDTDSDSDTEAKAEVEAEAAAEAVAEAEFAAATVDANSTSISGIGWYLVSSVRSSLIHHLHTYTFNSDKGYGRRNYNDEEIKKNIIQYILYHIHQCYDDGIPISIMVNRQQMNWDEYENGTQWMSIEAHIETIFISLNTKTNEQHQQQQQQQQQSISTIPSSTIRHYSSLLSFGCEHMYLSLISYIITSCSYDIDIIISKIIECLSHLQELMEHQEIISQNRKQNTKQKWMTVPTKRYQQEDHSYQYKLQ
jgi:hypothetical protein